MADWKTYAKAARNTARKQAPDARDAARRASGRAGGYVRAAGKAIDEGRRPDDAPHRRHDRAADAPRRNSAPRSSGTRSTSTRTADTGSTSTGSTSARSAGTGSTSTRSTDTGPSGARSSTPSRPRVDRDRLRNDAAAYYVVASRRAASVNVVPRIMRALRDALLIGISLVAIWAVLAAAGIPIPFTTVLIIVGVIVAASFGAGLYAQWKRSRAALDAAEDPRDR